MREVNEDASAYAGQRATAEAIERGGGGGLSVEALLAKLRTAAAPVPTGSDGGVAAAAVLDVVPDVEGPAAVPDVVLDVEGPAAAVPGVEARAAAVPDEGARWAAQARQRR
ncbi:hypothetical protein ABT113_54045, partial [Streptomyces mirabilis]